MSDDPESLALTCEWCGRPTPLRYCDDVCRRADKTGVLPDESADIEWTPGRYWQVLAPDGTVWCETSDEREARSSMRPGDTLWQEWRYERLEWRQVGYPSVTEEP